jgi:hypothetical protein
MSSWVGRIARGSSVLVFSLAYASYVCRIFDPAFWSSGVGDWMDPYFINAVLEHLYRSAARLTDPSSPPMFFPAPRTLGYSHGLVLYAFYYVPVRLFVHPFVAHNLTLFLAIAVGIVSLYVLLRRLRLSFVEALLLTAFFATSANVANGSMGVWSQRASVFLIPPILVLLHVSWQRRAERAGLVLGCVASLLLMLLYAQDIYTAHLAMLLAAFGAAAIAVVEGHVGRTTRAFWRSQSGRSLTALLIAAAVGGWVTYIWKFGGVELYVWGVKLASHNWRRPIWIAIAAFVAFLWLNRTAISRIRLPRPGRWQMAVLLGAIAGVIVVGWIYAHAYLQQPVFPEDQLLNSLIRRNPSGWRGPLDIVRDLRNFDSMRPFVLVFALALLAWVPWFTNDRKTRLYWVWFCAVSAFVVLVPVRFPDFSVWRTFIAPFPGFGAIRDPARIIYLYELGVVVAAALLFARLPAAAPHRWAAIGLLVALFATTDHGGPFHYARPIATFEQWVRAPLEIDPGCRSFYIKGASDAYMARSDHKWTLYNVDATFIALDREIPTLNGYSALTPDGWSLANPQEEPDYTKNVRRWIDRNRLTGVCELDIEARVMKPFTPTLSP